MRLDSHYKFSINDIFAYIISLAYRFDVYYRGARWGGGRGRELGRKISVHRSGPGAQAQTLRSEQTGGPISSVFAGGLAILLDTLFRSSDANADTDGLHR